MQERDRTHRAGSGDEDIVFVMSMAMMMCRIMNCARTRKALAVVMRILLMMMMMEMKILMARMMWMIDYEVCASVTGRDVEDDDSERDDDRYDDGDGDGDDGDVGVNERDNVDEDEMCKSKREQATLAKMRKIMIFSMMLKKVRIILRQSSNRLRMIVIILVWIMFPKTVRTR